MELRELARGDPHVGDEVGLLGQGEIPDLELHFQLVHHTTVLRDFHGAGVVARRGVGLGGRGRDFPRQLSGGELQRVAIARALVHRPALILADEPTGNLDPETADSIMQLLRAEIKASGASAIMVTHSHAAAEQADQTLTLTRQGLA